MNSLALDDISLSFIVKTAEKKIFRNFSYEFKRPGIYALTGPSGVGKSTLMKLLRGEQQATSGRILTDGAEPLSPLVENPKIFDNQELPSANFTVREAYTLNLSTTLESASVAEQHIVERIDHTPIFSLLDHRIKTLSTGEKRMVEYFRYRLFDADFYLFDEPFSGVAEVNIKLIEHDLLELSKSSGVIVTIHPQEMQKGFLDHCQRLALDEPR